MSAQQRLYRLARHLGFAVLVAAGLAACAEYPAESDNYGYAGDGFRVGAYPRMVLVPGMPVYYDPYSPLNYFFYDGFYWVYRYDSWYASSWYNGPWRMVGPGYVPYYLLCVPVRYYRAPPPYFHGWRPNEPPHWGEHYGHEWERRHGDWDDYYRHRQPPPPAAPLPGYQQAYSGNRYPRDPEQQEMIRRQHYRHAPRDYSPPQGQAPYAQPGAQQPQTPPPPMPPPPKKKDGRPQYQYQQYPSPGGDTPPPSGDQPAPRYQPMPQYQPAPQPQPTYQQPSSPSTHSSTPPESSSGKGHSKRSAPPGKDDGSGTQPNY